MPRVALSFEQRKAHKLKDIKGEIVKQMKLSRKTQKDIGDALGLSQSMVSKMLKTEGKNINPDPFTCGDLIVMFKLFEMKDEEIVRMFRV